MTDLLLIAVLLAQITQIVILLRRIDKPDLSKEDVDVKSLTQRSEDEAQNVIRATRNLPPKNKNN